ncbi:MAG TPA: CheR family methyltransferase [Thermoanaerobaculia bacterium]|nr:CheR family methyltransferase [Thermoanaerobaculia bacterium]HTQ08629.1 CheR family methyltransferase [Fimbriimonadaceae bacterium]
MSPFSCVELLQWALPRLSLRWPGFRRVHRQVCRRIGGRVGELKLPDLRAYKDYLEAHPEEWAFLDSLCWISISRFLRDRVVFDVLRTEVLPALAAAALTRGAHELKSWSAGCASGEEPYSLMILWKLELARRFPGLSLSVVATDIDERLLERARAARYRASSLRELPRAWVDEAFERSGDLFELRPELREGIEFRCEDIREKMARGPFDLILCRNLVFTYLDASRERETLDRILLELGPGGALVIGRRERLPEGSTGIEGWDSRPGIYRRAAAGDAALLPGTPAVQAPALGKAPHSVVERWT